MKASSIKILNLHVYQQLTLKPIAAGSLGSPSNGWTVCNEDTATPAQCRAATAVAMCLMISQQARLTTTSCNWSDSRPFITSFIPMAS